MLSFLPVQRALFGGVAIMGGPPIPVVPDLFAGFATATYEKDGVPYASFTAMGGTVTSGAVIDATGLVCDASGERAFIAYNGTSDGVLVIDADTPSTTSCLAEWKGATSYIRAIFAGVRVTQAVGTGAAAERVVSSLSKVAIGFQSGVLRVSVNGATVTTNAITGAVDLSSATLSIGRDNGGTLDPPSVPIRSVAIYKGTFTDAEIQALSA